MSKASKQTIVLLSMVKAAFIIIEELDLTPELAPTIVYGKSICDEGLKFFWFNNDTPKNRRWIKERVRQADGLLNETSTMYSAVVLASLAELIVNDLIQRIRDVRKLKFIEPIHEAVSGLSDQIDSKGIHFEAYEEAENHLKDLYRALEF